ncbi:S41 family peptidase [Cecembia rubra]|uniref:S41 family peptidase n=1 Tax=Cecembia rubra TaxID=1485585 RepID=UPI002714B6C5|nr:S41 family peptidase [Cecembia rubra]
MKTKVLLLFKLLIFNNLSFSFPLISSNGVCPCLEEFEFLKGYVERNHPAFGDNVNETNRVEYEEFVDLLFKAIQRDSINDHCIIYLKKYLAYFKDNHSQINDMGVQVDENDEESMKRFFSSSRFQQRERIPIDTEEIEAYLHSGNSELVEGIYESQDGTYKVALLRNQNGFRDYYGIILESQTRLWEPGQVKFELKKLDENLFEGFFYYKFYGLNYETVSLEENRLGTWIKLGASQNGQTFISPGNGQGQQLFEYKKIDEQTGYLAIRTFDGYFKNELDSLINAHENEILNLPHLIIDVRGNGGGSDALLAPFYSLFYTDTLKNELPQIYATQDNLITYQDLLQNLKADSLRYGRATIEHVEKMILKIQNAGEGEFVNMIDPVVSGIEEISFRFGTKDFIFKSTMGINNRYNLTYHPQKELLPSMPEKIVVLMDRGCASTCENFILLAHQSKKAITYGDNSGGYKGYGNVFSVKTPLGYNFKMSTTRYEQQAKFEFVGIPPKVRAVPNEDWIGKSLELFELEF